MIEVEFTPKRGEIYFVSGGGNFGSEQGGDRPAVVVSNDSGNLYSPVVEVVYLTTKPKTRLPTHTRLFSAARPSTALCEQITTVDKERLTRYIGRLSDDEMERLDAAMVVSLNLTKEDKDSMEVRIVSGFGENVFTMADEKVPTLLSYALSLAKGKSDEEQAAKEEKKEPEHPVEKPAEPIQMVAKRSRNDSLFGSDWRTRRETQEELPDRYEEEDGYKGFLLVECQHCGRRKGFCTKKRITESRCECGEYTPLKNMIPAHLKCKCGKTYKYLTNITDQEFEFDCLTCGSPVDLRLNKRQTAYVTVGDF